MVIVFMAVMAIEWWTLAEVVEVVVVDITRSDVARATLSPGLDALYAPRATIASLPLAVT
jgi:hypothetical protein